MTDAEIVDGIRLLARTEGIFAETAGRGHDRHTGQAGRLGRRPSRRARRRLRDGQRAQDPRRRRRPVRPDHHHSPHPGRLLGGLRRQRGALSHADEYGFPTQLRTLAGGAREVAVDGVDRRRGRSRASTPPIPASVTGSSTRAASCAASSTCSSPTRTSASSTGSTRRCVAGQTVSIVPCRRRRLSGRFRSGGLR